MIVAFRRRVSASTVVCIGGSIALWAAAIPLFRSIRAAKALQLDRRLIVAVRDKDARTVSMLLDRGADANATAEIAELEESEPPTVWAICRDLLRGRRKQRTEASVPLLLLTFQAFRHYVATRNGENVVRLSESELYPSGEDTASLKSLLDHGANLNTVYRGYSTAQWAAANRCSAALRMLIERGAPPDGPQGTFVSPLCAYAGGDMPEDDEMAAFLVHHGADVNFVGLSGAALDVAADRHNGEMMELLVSLGARASKARWRVIRSEANRTGWTSLVAVLDRHPEWGR